MKAILLRVGITTEDTGGDLAPIFPDGTFEYIPIPDRGVPIRSITYGNSIGRTGTPFAYYVPPRLQNVRLHHDPEFQSFTYGDPKRGKRETLLGLEPADLLVFYVGLSPYPIEGNHNPRGLYIIGFFTVSEVLHFLLLDHSERERFRQQYPSCAHSNRRHFDDELVIVVGKPESSRLLDHAILISDPRLDSDGRTYYAANATTEQSLGISGSMQRSAAMRVVKEPQHLDNLRRMLAL